MTNGNSDLLHGLPQSAVEEILSLGTRLPLTSSAELFHMGQEADTLYLVMRGRIRLTLPMQVRGREEEVFVEERTSGQTVGWSALIPPYRFTLTATAPLQTEVLSLPREVLRQYLATHSEVGYSVALNLASVIGERLQVFQAMWLREMERMVERRCA